MEIHEGGTLEMPVSRLWTALNDPNMLKMCVPGCEDIQAIDRDTYIAKAVVKVGFITSRFDKILVRRVSAVENHLLSYEMSGEDNNRIGSFRQTLQVTMKELQDAPPKTDVAIDATVELRGKFATLGKRIVEWKAKGITAEFMENVRKLATEGGS